MKSTPLQANFCKFLHNSNSISSAYRRKMDFIVFDTSSEKYSKLVHMTEIVLLVF